MSEVTITNSTLGIDKKMYGASATYSWKNLSTSKPVQHGYKNTEVQFSGWENPVIKMTVYFPQLNSADTEFITYDEFMTIVKNKPTLTNVTYLSFSTGIAGNETDKQFKSYADSETETIGKSSIPVTIMDFNLSLSAKEGKDGSFWTAQITFRETRED